MTTRSWAPNARANSSALTMNCGWANPRRRASAPNAANAAAGQAYIASLLEAGKARGELRDDLDIPVTSRFVAHALGEGMLEQIAGRLGMSLQEYLATPTATQRLSEEEIVQLVRHVIGLLRDGAGAKGAEQ